MDEDEDDADSISEDSISEIQQNSMFLDAMNQQRNCKNEEILSAESCIGGSAAAAAAANCSNSSSNRSTSPLGKKDYDNNIKVSNSNLDNLISLSSTASSWIPPNRYQLFIIIII